MTLPAKSFRDGFQDISKRLLLVFTEVCGNTSKVGWKCGVAWFGVHAPPVAGQALSGSLSLFPQGDAVSLILKASLFVLLSGPSIFAFCDSRAGRAQGVGVVLWLRLAASAADKSTAVFHLIL